MSNKKDVQVTIKVGAEDLASDKINQSVQAVRALSDATGIADKTIYKLNGGLMSMDRAFKVLAHFNNTIGLSTSQINIFARTIGTSSKDVHEYLRANSELTNEYKKQCDQVVDLQRKQEELLNKRKTDELQITGLMQRYQALGGNLNSVATDVEKYTKTLEKLDKLNSIKESLSSKKDAVYGNYANSDIQKSIDAQRKTIAELEEKKNALKIANANATDITTKSKTASEIGAVMKEIDALNKHVEELKIKFKDMLTPEESKRIEELNNGLEKCNALYVKLNSTLPNNARELTNTGEAILRLSSEYRESEQTSQKLDTEIQELTNSIAEQSGVINTTDGVLNAYTENTHDSIKSQDDAKESNDNLTDSLVSAAIQYKVVNKALELGKKLYDEYCNTLEQVGEFALNAGGAIVDGFGQALDVAERLIDITSEACAKFKTLADEGTELQKNWFKLYNYLGESSGGEYADYLGDLTDRLNIDADHILKSSEGILSMVSNLGVSADQVDDAMKAFTNMGLDLSAFTGGDVGDVMMQLESAVNLGLLDRRSVITRSLNLTGEEVKQFRELNTVQERANFILSRGEEFRGNYEKWLQTAGGKVSQLNSSISSLTGTLQKMATGILAKFAPIITHVIKLLDKLANSIASVLGIDLTTAEANMSSGFDGIVSGAESASEALDDTTASAKALDRQVASFDDVIQLNDNKSSSKSDNSTSGSEYSGVINTADWIKDWLPEPEKTPFEEWLDELYDKLTNKQWYEAGKHIIDSIVSAFKKIDWAAIKDFVQGFTDGLADLIRGILADGTLGKTVGTGLAELTNIIVSGLNSIFGDHELFENLGKSIAELIHSFFTNIDAEDISSLLSNVVKDIFYTLGSFLDTMDGNDTWNTIGTNISDIINGFFSDFTVEDVKTAANNVIRFIDGIFTSIGAFITNLDTEDIKTKFTEFIRSLFNEFKDNQDEWASTLKEFTDFIIDMINILITEWDSSGMSNAIIKFISDSGIGELVWDLLKTKFKVQFEKFEIEFISGLEAFLGEVLGVIGNIIGYIIVGITGLLGAIAGGTVQLQDFLHEKTEGFFTMLENIAEFIGNCIGGIAQGIAQVIAYIIGLIAIPIGAIMGAGVQLSDFITGNLSEIKEMFNYCVDDIVSFFEDGIKSISDWFNWLLEQVTGIAGGIGDAISDLWDKIKNMPDTIGGVWDNITSIPDKIGSTFFSVRNSLGIDTDLPALANGGIVKRASLALIGEQGKEAVIPLENNTGWMDSMANSLVNAMNNKSGSMSNAGGQVVLDMSKCTKQVYTRAEMMAFGRLITDALNTYGTNVAYNH